MHQYASGRVAGQSSRGPNIVSANTDYPWQGRSELAERFRPDLLGGVTTVTATGRLRPPERGADWWPYRTERRAVTARPKRTRPPVRAQALTLTAVPYYAWANREDGAMRVWLLTS